MEILALWTTEVDLLWSEYDLVKSWLMFWFGVYTINTSYVWYTSIVVVGRMAYTTDPLVSALCPHVAPRGKKFNSLKEDCIGEDYLGIRRFRFYIKCVICSQ